MTVDQYMNQQVCFGGEWVTIGFLYEKLGDKAAGYWLAGYERNGGETRS